MQDDYAGDVGDFGKYGLLNELCSADGRRGPALTLGVLWYAPCYRCVAEESGTQTDGQKTDYLLPDKCRPFRQCDPRLWEEMHSIVHGHRSIAAVERSEALLARDEVPLRTAGLRVPRAALEEGGEREAAAHLAARWPDGRQGHRLGIR